MRKYKARLAMGLAAAGTATAITFATWPANALEPQAAATEGKFRLVPISLNCIATEDFVGGDEIFMQFNELTVFGVQSISRQQTLSLTGDPRLANLRFSQRAQISLLDADTGIFDDDDFLGAVDVDASMADGAERTDVFNGDGATYFFRFKVVAE